MADALRSIGHEALVPNLVGAARTGDPGAFVRAAVDAARSKDDLIVVGHSGAGALLPCVAARLAPSVRMTVWVDAGMPPCEGSYRTGGDFLPTLRALADNGMLPEWAQWWGDGVLEALVRNDQRRREIEQELPNVPLAFYEAAIKVPIGWCAGPGAYVLLSDAYRSDAATAASRGWPVVERLGAHLDIVNDEEAIAAILTNLADHP